MSDRQFFLQSSGLFTHENVVRWCRIRRICNDVGVKGRTWAPRTQIPLLLFSIELSNVCHKAKTDTSNRTSGHGPLLQEWLEAADTRAQLLRYLKEQVPRIFCLKTESSPQEEEELMQRRLLHPLECFLFGEDPQEGLEKLKQGSTSSQLCGRVFKEGETVYSCRSELTHSSSGIIIIIKKNPSQH